MRRDDDLGLRPRRPAALRVADERVLAAIASIPREQFVPDARARCGPTRTWRCRSPASRRSRSRSSSRGCSSCCELRPSDRVLDVGTGSGYHAALLALLARHVWTIERHAELSAEARRTIAALGHRQRRVLSSATAGTASPSTRRSTRSTSRRRPVTRSPRRSSSSWPTAAGWSPRSASAEQHLIVTDRARGDGFERDRGWNRCASSRSSATPAEAGGA